MHPHHAAIHVAVPAPHVGEQLVGGHHKAGPLHEHLQDLELPPAEALAFPLPAQLIGGTVQGKAAHRQQIRQVILLAAEHSPHPGQQLRGGAGLGEVVVRAGVQSRHPLGDFRHGREEQRRGGYPLASQLPQHLQAVYAGHGNVQNQPVILGGLRVAQGAPAVAYAVHHILVVLQKALKGRAHLGVVLRD